jgi:hypothetical protein
MQLTMEQLENIMKLMYLQGKASILSPNTSHNLGFNGVKDDLLVQLGLKEVENCF